MAGPFWLILILKDLWKFREDYSEKFGVPTGVLKLMPVKPRGTAMTTTRSTLMNQSFSGATGPYDDYRRQKGKTERSKISYTKPPKQTVTTPARETFSEDCDYISHYCLQAYRTGKVCGRSLYYLFETFEDYCKLDYVNCMERYEIWQVAYMGPCYRLQDLKEYIVYDYKDDRFLDKDYVDTRK